MDGEIPIQQTPAPPIAMATGMRSHYAARRRLVRVVMWSLPFLAVAALPPIAYVVTTTAKITLPVRLALLMPPFFAVCLACHVELACLKPHPRHLSSFYLMIALGGALGGIFAGVVAPLVFESYHELPLSLAQCPGDVLAIRQLPVESNHKRCGFCVRYGNNGPDELLGAQRQQGGAKPEQFVAGTHHRPPAVAGREHQSRGHPLEPFQVKDREGAVGEPQR